MTTYTLNLTPTVRNRASEGSLDTSILNGVSIQRTGFIEVANGTLRKIACRVKDGASFNDTADALTSLGFIS